MLPETSSASTTQATSTQLLEPKAAKDSIKHLEKNHQTIVNALNYLENTKQKLEKADDKKRMERLDSLVDELSSQTQDYIDDLEKIKNRASNNQDVKDRINYSEKELKERFKLESKENERSSEDNEKNGQTERRQNQPDN